MLNLALSFDYNTIFDLMLRCQGGCTRYESAQDLARGWQSIGPSLHQSKDPSYGLNFL